MPQFPEVDVALRPSWVFGGFVFFPGIRWRFLLQIDISTWRGQPCCEATIHPGYEVRPGSAWLKWSVSLLGSDAVTLMKIVPYRCKMTSSA